MKYPKVRNKQMRVKIEYDITIEDLTTAFGELIYNLTYMNPEISFWDKKVDDYADVFFKKITKADIFCELKKLLDKKGSNMWTASENWSSFGEEIYKFAETNISKYFPEMV